MAAGCAAPRPNAAGSERGGVARSGTSRRRGEGRDGGPGTSEPRPRPRALGAAGRGWLMRVVLVLVGACRGASALDVQFRVVSPDGVPSVSVNGNPPQAMAQLTSAPPAGASISGAPYYTTVVPGLTPPFKYRYVLNGNPEGFERDFPGDGGRTATYNDFFNRKDTLVKLPALPLVFGQKWGRGWGATPLFDDSYIPTLYLQGDQAAIDGVLTASTSAAANLTMAAIFRDDVFVFPLTEWKSSGLNRKLQFAKRGFEIKLAQKLDIYGRDEWKLNAMVLDPVAMREKAFTDLADAAGLPVPRATYVRLYVNSSPIGFYVMADNPASNSYLRAEFHGDINYKQFSVYGSLVKAEDPFFFIYNGPERTDYPQVSVRYLGNNPATNPLQNLISRWIAPLMMLKTGDESAIQNTIAPAVDVDMLLKSAALEWLAGYWRGAWGKADEFVIYEDPITNKWHYVLNNPSETFGVGITPPEFPANFVTQSFRLYSYKKPRPLIQKLMATPAYGNYVAWCISELVRTAFNPGALGTRLQAISARIRPEVEWDRSLRRFSPGSPDLYTIADFDDGLKATAAKVVASANSTATAREGAGGNASPTAVAPSQAPSNPAATGTAVESLVARPPVRTILPRAVLQPATPSTPEVPGVALGILSWVEQRASAVAAELKVTPEQSLTGPDPVITPPSAEQLKGPKSLLNGAASRNTRAAWMLLTVAAAGLTTRL